MARIAVSRYAVITAMEFITGALMFPAVTFRFSVPVRCGLIFSCRFFSLFPSSSPPPPGLTRRIRFGQMIERRLHENYNLHDTANLPFIDTQTLHSTLVRNPRQTLKKKKKRKTTMKKKKKKRKNDNKIFVQIPFRH